MKKIQVLIAGYDLIGKRVADAVAVQSDMALHGIVDDNWQRLQMAQRKGYAVHRVADSRQLLGMDVVVQCGEAPTGNATTVIHDPRSCHTLPICFSILSNAAEILGQPLVKMAAPNVTAFARIAHALRDLGPTRRWCATAILRCGHASDRAAGRVDALEPLFLEPAEDFEMQLVLGQVTPSIRVGRVIVPYTHFNLHLMKLDFDAPVSVEQALTLLGQAPRILVGKAKDGWKSTAHLQEFCRDIGRPRADRPELFIWEESVQAVRRSLCLTMDLEPEATPVPEIIDAIRLSQRPGMTMLESVHVTDTALGLGRWSAPAITSNL
ncbi:MAG: hypothetical protein ABSF38_03235 [Verrucomicrobiota bacterium]|jgi:glyceraldehyde-3-phosphate dehydrogenase (NAD(P))